ncbi:MAG TPA: choice-of-anchor tandem repeat GloVer-containing protein, partial [Candidatus Baltobacteraceae bacterium]|nr:choice-of-anchor tandem repeat GloVer-containing protein [Candidatus Baltobacteraceae bacterium]
MKSRLPIAALLFIQFATIAQSVHTQTLHGHVPVAIAPLTAVGRLEPSRELRLAIGLPLRNKEGLTNLLQRIYDPASPDFHHYLTPAQFADSFGPTEEDYRAVAAFAKSNGLKVTATHSNRALLDVTGSVSNIEKAFHLTIRTYWNQRENRLFYAPDTEPSLNLATPVLHISGLDNYLQPHPMSLRETPIFGSAPAASATGSGVGGAYLGNDFRAAYVPDLALSGTGQTVGLVEFDGYYASDISAYAIIAGLPSVPLTNVYLDGFTGTPGNNNVEVALDIDMASSMAPGLTSVIVYEGEVTDDILNRMATDALANQLSASWTYVIDSVTEQIFQQFAAQGQSFFNAAGDNDAWVGQIATPCDDPNIISVGGTTLTTSGPAGAWVSETVWNWDVEYGASFNGQGSGGGISTTYTIPSWQLGVSMTTNQGSPQFRNIPDVALTADNVFVVANNGQQENVGGTSCAAPLWAAFIALANEQAATNGRPTVGFINPAIYALGLSVNYTNCFHDIITGNNTWSDSPTRFYAVPGYDLCSGWGTPTGRNLINLLALDSLQISPPGSRASSGTVGGPLTPASQTYILTNSGSTALQWATSPGAPWLSVSLNGGTLFPGGAAATEVVSLNSAASNLLLGNYGATIWFTNLTDGAIQSRVFSLAIIKPPVILAQPASLVLIGGTTATFTASAAGGLPLNCQWERNGINMTDGGRVSGSQSTLTDPVNIYGSLASTLTISNVTASDGGTYALIASNAVGMVVTSNAVLAVVPSGPVIVQQPASQTVLVGAMAQFSIVADGTAPFNYQWQQNETNLMDGGPVSGALTPTLTINGASSASIGTYTVVVGDVLGTATSTGAVLTVQVAGGGELVQNGGFEIGDFSYWGKTGNFANASVSGSSTAVHSGNYGAMLGAAGSLGYLSQSLPTVAGQYYQLSLWLDSPDGILPNEFLVAWNGTVMFDQTNLGAIGWTNLQFLVMATDTNTLLQFGFRDDQSFLGLDDIQVIPLVSADGPPIVATQPASQMSVQGGAVTFSVLSSGQFPLIYQWQFDGTNLDDATNATLALTNLTSSQAGTYNVLISNSLGSTASSNALLTVLPGEQELITFDDLPYRLLPVPSGYGDLTWSNFDYLNGVVGRASGYTAGMVSIPKVAYNANGAPAAISASAPFVLYSAYLTGAWDDDLQVQVQGFNGSSLIYDNTYTLSATNPTQIAFNYVDVTSVKFTTSGGIPHFGYTGSGKEFAMDNVNAFVAPIPPPPPPTPVAVLYYFDGMDGGHPFSALAQGTDGNFYGTTEYGGSNGYGTVFRMSTNGTLTTLYSFGAANAYPCAALVQGADGLFYGTTTEGGTNDYGTVFSITTNGTLFTLASFNYSVTGGNPSAALVQGTDGNLYGTAPFGGANDYGTVFRMTTNGTLSTLVAFDNANGTVPYAALAQGADGNFYGTTYLGGSYSTGTVFRMATNGTLTTLVSLDGFNAYPYGALTQGADGNFYGTSEYGGTNDYGTVFSVTTNGTLSTLASFNYYVTGGYPSAALVQGTDGNLYGTTSSGGTYGTTYFDGTYGGGTIFSITTNGILTTLLSFQNTNGLYTQAGLVQGADGYFYGTAPYGGVGFNGYYDSGDGVVFRLGAAPTTTPPAIVAQPVSQTVPVSGAPFFSVNATGAAPLSYSWQRNGSPIAGATQSGYTTNNVQLVDSGDRFSCVISNVYGSVISSNAALTVINGSGALFTFDGPDGAYPSASLIQGADGNFYGTTQYGGTNGNGTVFRMTTNGTYSILASLNYYVTGANPLAALALGADGNFYGTATEGGRHDEGTVFEITTNGTLTVLHSFDGSDGAEPSGTLVQGADGNLYGTTYSGGTSGYGTIFRMTTAGTLTTLFTFDYSNGAYPQGALVQGADGYFYGTAPVGGANYAGTVFRTTTNGALTTLLSFNNTNGAYPQAALVQGADGLFYGATTEGGSNGYGTVFSLTTNGTLTSLFSFEGTNGSYPQASLVQGADGLLYGATTEGGTNGYGTVFSVTTNGAVISRYSFAGTNGSYPAAALIQGADGNFYGTTAYGGVGYDGLYWSGSGAVFRLAGTFPPEAPMIVTQPASQTVLVGGTAAFSVTAAGSRPLNYFWQRNGTNIAGATLSTFATSNVQLSDSGSVFSCLVSNVYGVKASINATLTVVAGIPGLITFDNLIGTHLPVPNGYFGLTWSNFYYLNGVDYGEPSGFTAGVVSTNNIAYNNGGTPAAVSASAPFNFVSGYLTAAWNDNLQVEVKGYNGAALIYDNTYILSATTPTLIMFNYMGVTSVQFSSSGGTVHPGYAGGGSQFVMDNVTVVTLPTPPVPVPLPTPMPMAVLYSFDGFDGGRPSSALMQGADGNFYGTTEYGGAYEYGTVF